MTHTATGVDAAAQLDRELAVLQQVERALRDERHALEQQDLAALEAAVAAKNGALAQHADLAPQGPVGPGHTAAESATTAGLEQRRTALRALGETCDQLNRENGSLIHRMQARTRQALDILRQSDRSPRLYSGAGTAEQSAGRHSLGKA
ncbi:MAG: flagellar protein FlgN [Chromatocurvus sp.]